MLTVFIVLAIIAATIVTIAIREDKKKDAISEAAKSEESPKCGCGNTKNVDGLCDGSHNNVPASNDNI